ncbi:MAG: hypothetical protein U0031_01055 [Thermomicrobiales bacterium]
MDGSNFDAWTRRRFGLAAGGLAGTALTAIGGERVAGKKKKVKCKDLGESCSTSGGKKCCKCLACAPDSLDRFRCCKNHGEPCTTATANQCCSQTCTGGFCVCKTNGQPCAQDNQCCSLNCNGTCQP